MNGSYTVENLVADVETEVLAAGSVATPVLRTIRKKISKQIQSVDRHTVLAAAIALIERDRVSRFIPYELVRYHPATFEKITPLEVEQLSTGMNDWVAVDTFATCISGPAWAADRASDAKIELWAKSSDRWRRRAALVSTVALNRRPPSKDATERTLKICRMLTEDRDDMVVKAMSWALRRLGTHDPASVRNFMEEHKVEIASRVLREVTRKLETGRKDGRAAAHQAST